MKSYLIKDTTKEELSKMMVGRDVNFVVEKQEQKVGDVVLAVENVSVPSKIGKKDVVRNVSFEVRAGEIVCLAGIDGNGQTEFVSALTGLEKVNGGTIKLCGKDITKANVRTRSTSGMSHIPEDRHKHGLVLDYSLEENMILQRYFEPKFQKFGFIKKKETCSHSNYTHN